MEKYYNVAHEYATDVVGGVRVGCKQEVQACQRFLDDIEREGFRYIIDIEKGGNACYFLENLPHTKGKWAAGKQNLKLEPWQTFIVFNLFGWVDGDGLRRFRDCYLKIPRKNGKSILAAGIGLYMLSADGEYGAEVYSGATSERQAWEVFGPARIMCQKTPDLCEAFGVEVNAKTLVVQSDNSKFEPMIGNPRDGSSPSCAIIDEYHEHDTDNMAETMATGMGARTQPMLLKITTAGSSNGGPCHQAEADYIKMLDGVFDDDRAFVMMFGIDEGDDWTDPDVLRKANPNYDVSVSAEFLIENQKTAMRNPAKQNAFKRKHLNVWVGAHTAWLNMETWNSLADDTLSINDFTNDTCIFSLDLASRIDVTAFLQVFMRVIDDKRHYYTFSRFYLPESRVYSDAGKVYQSWVNSGYMSATDGDEIDFNEIQSDIVDQMALYSVNEVVYDPWRATQLAQGLVSEGATAVEFRNTVANMSPAMFELEAAIESKRLHHDGNPVLSWMASNVVAKIDAKDNIFPRKERPDNKIDGMVALIMAIGRLMHTETGAGLDSFLNNI